MEERGGIPLIFSTIETRLAVPEGEMEAFLEAFSRSTWVVFTSGKGLEFLLQVLGTNHDTPLSSKKVAVVGRKTAALLEEVGVRADCIPEREDSRFLAEALLKKLKKNDLVFFPRAKKGRKELVEILEGSGTRIVSPILYETVAPRYGRGEIEGILNSRVEYATFTSPSTFENFIELAGKESSSIFLKNVKIAVIGDTTAASVRESGYPVSVMPEYPDGERLLDAVSADILRSSSHEEE